VPDGFLAPKLSSRKRDNFGCTYTRPRANTHTGTHSLSAVT